MLTSSEFGYPLSKMQRGMLIVASLFLMGGFFTASTVTPDERGFGTHQKFGLPPCTFQSMFGIPCPSCGGTTCFAHYVRGQWIQSAKANPVLFVFANICALSIPWFLYSSWSGRLWRVDEPSKLFVYFMITICSFAMLLWLVRIAF